MNAPTEPVIDSASPPSRLPPGLAPYKRTPEFDAHSLPAGLRRDHSTKPGVWALIHVLQGRLRYCVPQWRLDVELAPGAPGIVAPQVPHFVEPLSEGLRLYVEFHARPDAGEDAPHQAPHP